MEIGTATKKRSVWFENTFHTICFSFLPVVPLIETLNFIPLEQLGESTSLTNRALHFTSKPKIYGECNFHGPCLQKDRALCQQNYFLSDLSFDKIVDEQEQNEAENLGKEHSFEDGYFNDMGKTVLKIGERIMQVPEVPPPMNIIGFNSITLK